MSIKTYLNIWLRSSILSLETIMVTWLASLGYLMGKWIRFGFFWWFINRIGQSLGTIHAYTADQLILFFLIFNLLDMLGQIVFRGVYWFRQDVISGQFDLTLLKPVNPIFLVLARRVDVLDLPLFGYVCWLLILYGSEMSLNWGLFGLMIGVSIFVILAIHITAAAVGVLTMEVEQMLWVYRDTSLMTRFPVFIYSGVVQGLLFTVLPVGIIMTIPAQALVGFLTGWQFLLAVTVAFLWFLGSLRLWKYALSRYTSASS